MHWPLLNARQRGFGSLPALAFALIILATAPAGAGDGLWQHEPYSSLRLIDGGVENEQTRLAGIEIKLKPGWKTYWRTPGDSGIPPRFDFSGSDNVAHVTVLWPVPAAFDDGGGGLSFGYHDRVIFPLRVAPKDAARPVTLKLSAQYAACERLCVPASALTQTTLAGTPVSRTDLALALARVPRRVAPGPDHALRAIQRDAAGAKLLIDVATATPNVTLFAEGPTPDWAIPLPKEVDSGEPGLRRFAISTDGAPASLKSRGFDLRITLAADAGSEEAQVAVPPSGP